MCPGTSHSLPAITYARDLGWCLWGADIVNGVQERRSNVAMRGHLVVGPGGNSVACADDDGLRITDGTHHRRVTSEDSWGMTWSPDGAFLAFCTDAGTHVLRSRTSRAGADSKRITPAAATSVVWSPDGTRVAFSIWGKGVFVTSLSGDPQQLVSGYAGDLGWSPDCTEIAFSIPGRGIACVDVATGAERALTSHPEDEGPVWSPDGKVVAYRRLYPGELRTVRADSTEDTLLRGDKATGVAWSPDSSHIAYTSEGRYYEGTSVAVVDARSGQPQMLIGGGSQPVWVDDERIAWLRWMGGAIRAVDLEGNRTDLHVYRGANAVRSPDGQHIAYIDQETPPDARLMLSDRHGHDPRELAVGETSAPMWLADSTRVAWVSPDGTHTSTVDGTQRQRFAEGANWWGGCCLVEPEFSPDGTRMAYATRDGLVVTASDDRATVLPGSSPHGHVAWSPDGTRMAYTTRDGLVVTASDDRATVLPGSSPHGHVAWSPDGTHLAYPSPEGLVIVDTRGPAKRIVSEGGPAGCPVWSPDSNRLACYKRHCDESPLFFVDIRSGETRTVWPGSVSAIAWAPDSARVTFIAGGDVVVIAGESGHLHRIVRDAGALDIRWAGVAPIP